MCATSLQNTTLYSLEKRSYKMYSRIDVLVQHLVLLGVSFMWEAADAEENTSTINHSTDRVLTSSDNFPSLQYLNTSGEHPVNNSFDNWLKEEFQNVFNEYDNQTLSLNFTKVVSKSPGHDEIMMGSTTEFLNNRDTSIRRFKAHDLVKVLQILHKPENQQTHAFNRFSSYNLFAFLEAEEKKCTKDPERNGSCACDPDCHKYGDCCPDSTHFRPQEQTLGSSSYKCTQTANGNVFTVNTCHSGWHDSFVRYKCEHPDKSYGDPLRYIPVTSLRTNISYRNPHCAVCNNDYLHNNIQLWHVVIRSTFKFNVLQYFEEPVRRLVYVSENATWYLNLTGAYIRAQSFGLEECQPTEDVVIMYNRRIQSMHTITLEQHHHSVAKSPLIKCSLLPLIPENVASYLRHCEISEHKCADNWKDISVKELCEAYYAPVQHCQKIYRNRHCVKCNNWDPEVKSSCTHKIPQEFDVSWNFGQQFCEKLHVFDPLLLQCRLLFNPKEYKPESIQKQDPIRRMMLQTGEYILSNDRSTVFVPTHNRLYRQYEFVVQDKQIILYLYQSSEGHYLPELDYVSITSACVSILMLILHIVISLVIPETGLMEKNLRSFCFSLLLVYASFIVGGTMTLGSTSCMITATLLHYALLVSSFWMLIIPLDILKTIKRTVSIKHYLTENRCGTFHLYSSSSWLTPIIIVGLALAVDLLRPESSFAPGYGKLICWFNHANALISFCLVPFAFVLVLNTILICWSAYLIFDNEETFELRRTLRTEFCFSARLVILANLCWAMGILATYINTHGAWYIFEILHALQGVHIFFASSFTRIGKKMLIL